MFFFFFFFFFNDTATTEIYTLSLHDALPICSFLDTAVDANGCGEQQTLDSPGLRKKRSRILRVQSDFDRMPAARRQVGVDAAAVRDPKLPGDQIGPGDELRDRVR